MNPREGEKKEADPNYCSNIPKNSTSSSRHWSSLSFKNPRIVRVSRAFGGKDRHSKVCTVRGLRDRRIRLSVPTAIQLYDLQDKLGLSQPSKVVDWLIDKTSHEIDKLPPLPNFTHFHNPALASHEPSPHSLPDLLSHQQLNEEGLGGFVAQLSSQSFFPISSTQFAAPNMPYSSNLFHWDPPSLSLSQLGGGYSFAPQTEEQPHSSLSSSLPSSSQLYLCPSAVTAPSITPPFPSYVLPPSMENIHDYLRQINHLQTGQQNSALPTTLHL